MYRKSSWILWGLAIRVPLSEGDPVVVDSIYKLLMKKYQKGKLIGSGNFGSVYELKCLSTGKLYALKELKYNK